MPQPRSDEFSMTQGGPLWRQIRAALAQDIAAGRYAPGDKLPSEGELARRFAVNRHTLRRALADLRDVGAIYVRRGAGAYVTEARIDYPLGARTRFAANLGRAGRSTSREILRLETLWAEPAQAEALGLDPGGPVHLVESVGLGDGVPLTVAHSAFPAARLPGLPEALRASGSVTAALAACGVADYQRRWTRLTACAAEAVTARRLRVAPGHPLLRATSLNCDAAGAPVEFGRTWFCTERIELIVEPAGFVDLSGGLT